MSDFSLSFSPLLLNAAGSLGFAPERRVLEGLPPLGAFFTNPISLTRRTPAHGRRFAETPGGFLLHTGYPNPGLKAVLRHHAARWGGGVMPVWVHLLAQGAGEVKRMARTLEGVEGVAGVEVGIPPEMDAVTARAFLEAALGELPMIARLPLDRAADLAGMALSSGASAISLGPPRGALPAPGGGLLHGRLYGPAVFPLALEAVRGLSRRGIPVVGAGGVYRQEQVEAMLSAGAVAVQLDAVLWRGYALPGD